MTRVIAFMPANCENPGAGAAVKGAARTLKVKLIRLIQQ
jgi:hypothetical protein